ncbi:MAG: FkbM family methyltransferase [Steroidobacteraceae bacterium]
MKVATFAKALIKRIFPGAVLRWRARRIVSSNIDPDLYLLANCSRYLADLPDGETCIGRISKNHAALDVGACGGEYSIIMASMFGKVLAVEPTSDMADLLRRSLPRNCEVVECALGDSPREVLLRVPTIEGSRLHALATVADHSFEFSSIGAVDGALVKQLTIDELVSERGVNPSFIKIDVEGYEGNVLKGALEVLRTFRPILMVEIEKRHNRHFGEIFSLLGSLGYVAYHFHAGKLVESGPATVEESYAHLISDKVSGIQELLASKMTERYINNFVFLPRTGGLEDVRSSRFSTTD